MTPSSIALIFFLSLIRGRKKNKKEFTVSIGDYNRKVKDEEEQNLTVDKMIIHPNYTTSQYQN